MTKDMSAEDDTIDTARAVADVSCFASYLQVQGGAMTKRTDQPLCIDYEETEPNQYGETRKVIVGVKNRFSLAAVRTKLKNWVIKKGVIHSDNADSETTETNKGHSPAWTWTCVSNCNRSKLVQKLKILMEPIGFMPSEQHLNYLFKYGRLRLNDYRWIIYENDDVFIKEEKISLFSVRNFGEEIGGFWG